MTSSGWSAASAGRAGSTNGPSDGHGRERIVIQAILDGYRRSGGPPARGSRRLHPHGVRAGPLRRHRRGPVARGRRRRRDWSDRAAAQRVAARAFAAALGPCNRTARITADRGRRVVHAIPKLVVGAAVALLIAAAADPFLPSTEEFAGSLDSRLRVDLIDVSGSMGWEFPGTHASKAQVARDAYLKFLEMRRGKNDRVSLWLFSTLSVHGRRFRDRRRAVLLRGVGRSLSDDPIARSGDDRAGRERSGSFRRKATATSSGRCRPSSGSSTRTNRVPGSCAARHAPCWS